MVETVEMMEMVETVEMMETVETVETVEMMETAETVETVETVEIPDPETSLAFRLQSHTLPKAQASLSMKEALQASRSHWERWLSFYFRTLFDWKQSS